MAKSTEEESSSEESSENESESEGSARNNFDKVPQFVVSESHSRGEDSSNEDD